MHAVVFQVDFVPGRESQTTAELDFIASTIQSTPGFIRGTWSNDDSRGLSFLLFESEQAARAVASNASLPPDAAVTLRSVDVYEVARDVHAHAGVGR